MNELTGIFIDSIERGEDLDKIKSALLNSGYSFQDIENAFMEAQEFYKIESTQLPKINEKTNKKTYLLIIIFLLILIIISFSVYYFLLGGKNVFPIDRLLPFLRNTK